MAHHFPLSENIYDQNLKIPNMTNLTEEQFAAKVAEMIEASEKAAKEALVVCAAKYLRL